MKYLYLLIIFFSCNTNDASHSHYMYLKYFIIIALENIHNVSGFFYVLLAVKLLMLDVIFLNLSENYTAFLRTVVTDELTSLMMCIRRQFPY